MFSEAATDQTDLDGYVIMKNLNLIDTHATNLYEDADNDIFFENCRSNALQPRVCPDITGPPVCLRHKSPFTPSFPRPPASPAPTRPRALSNNTAPLFFSPSSSLSYSPTDWRDLTCSPLSSPRTDGTNCRPDTIDPLDKRHNLNLHFLTFHNYTGTYYLHFLTLLFEIPLFQTQGVNLMPVLWNSPRRPPYLDGHHPNLPSALRCPRPAESESPVI